MTDFINITIIAIVTLTLILVGLDVSPAEFRRLLQKPKPLLVGFIGILFLVPLAYIITRIFSAPPEITIGLLLVAMCPIGNMSNLFVFLARCNTALSLSICVTTTLAAFLTMPFWIWALGHLIGEGFDFEVPGFALIIRMFFLLALPVSIGMWLKARFPELKRRFHKILRRTNTVFMIGLGLFVMFNESEAFTRNIIPTALLAITFTLLAMLTGFLLSMATRLSLRDTLTLMLLFPVRNIGIAIAMSVTIFNDDQFAVFGTAMFMSQIPFFIGTAIFIRRKGLGQEGIDNSDTNTSNLVS